MRFSSSDIQRFAAWSGDRTPLHTDAEFVRQTPPGRPAAHGLLTAIEALRAAAPQVAGRRITRLEIDFPGVVAADEDYDFNLRFGQGAFTVALEKDGRAAVSVRAGFDEVQDAPETDRWWERESVAPAERAGAEQRTGEELARGVELIGRYAMSPGEAGVNFDPLSQTQARVLALCSYITGMELPGPRSLTTHVSVQFHADAPEASELWYRARTTKFEPQSGVVDAEFDVVNPDGVAVARGVLRSSLTEKAQPAGAPVSTAEPRPRAEFAVRLAASFTTDPLVAPLEFWLDELDLAGSVDVAPYGQVLQALLDPGSVLNAKGRGLNVILLRVRDWLRELADEQVEDIEFVRSYLSDTMRDFDRAVRAHRGQAAAETLLLLCPSHGALSSAESILVRQIETDVAAALAGVAGLQIAAASDFHATYGVNEDDVYDALRDEIAHIPYRDEYLHVLASIVARQVHRRVWPARKVVVVDCDNTLWRGVVGEVGAEGIAFEAQHLELQRTLERLAKSGVLICLCSKNEESDVWRVFETRPDMLLPRESVVAAMVNWQPKSQNIRVLAGKLNLGLDSFVFIDDNPVECAEVRAGCPEVLTIQWPEDSTRALQLLRHIWEFDARNATKEDARRTDMYREEFRRQEARAETMTFEDFIRDLQLVVDFAPLSPEDLKRAAQLTLRTNQFNFTTIRRDEADVQALVAGGRHEIRTVRVRDRFGDYGLVGLLIAERGDDAWTLDTFLLSCRVLGRGVEYRIMAQLGEMAVAAGARAVRLRIETTKRNKPARSFIETFVPPEIAHADERGFACEMSAEQLAAVRFEPATIGEVVVAEDGGAAADQSADTSRVRRREDQIGRAAFTHATGRDLRAMVEGRPAPAESPKAAAHGDIAVAVQTAFASALRLPVEKVIEIDQLEALGCDSLKIVEITVALSERFPSMPGTLLFEHRSVREIVDELAALLTPRAAAASSPATVSTTPGARASAGIAVVGMHLRCAGADSPQELWDLLSRGASAVRPVPVNREHFLQPLNDTRSHWAGLIDNPARFDAELFGVSPREAEYMDPQLRLFLEVAWNALEDAGSLGDAHEPNTGVFAGVMYGDYGSRANIAPTANNSPYRCWEGFSLANRLSQLLGFSGPSLAVDTACSSSGTALHLACASLNAGDCRVAIVGGVNLILDSDRFAALGRLGILSERGKCEPFGADADGTVLGEGAGVVVLRPLDEALRRGDRIYGVIKGTGVSTGSGTVGFTAPNPQAQAEAIRRALDRAQIDPRTVAYIETHGTGTHLGDPIEVRGLTLGYGTPELQDPALPLEQRTRMGSIKANIGHLEAGAGVLGVIKALLQLHRRTFLPSISSPEPNPQITFASGVFDVQTTLEPWPARSVMVNGEVVSIPRRAAVSSFGVGGANAHVILEEAPATEVREAGVDRPAHVLALSARSEEGLSRQAARLRSFLQGDADTPIADVCYSVNTGRKPLRHRLAFAAASREELVQGLDVASRGETPKRGARQVAMTATGQPKVAFLYTGQGSQYAGMGRPLYESQPVFREALDRCAVVFDRLLDRPLLDLLFAREGSADADLLNQTGYTQPALFAFQYALSELWASWGVRPDIVMGHSVGEIAALCVAGGVSLEDGLKQIAARGRLMQALPAGGTMASVMADEARVLAAIAGEELVTIAAINAPEQIVISGDGGAVAEITARLAADGIKTKSLTVSHAFHSPLMKPMLAEYERVVRQIRFSPPRIPFVSCVDGALVQDEVTRPDYWLRQVLDPVRFAAGMNALDREQVACYVEIGPSPVLLGMGRQCVANSEPADWLPSMRRDSDTWQTLLGSLSSLYARGAAVDWRGFDAPYGRQRRTVPGFEFSPKRYWLRRLPQMEVAAAVAPEETTTAAPVYDLAWRPQPLAAAQPASREPWVILSDRGPIALAIERELRAAGAAVMMADRAAALDRHLANGAAPRIVYVADTQAASDAFDASTPPSELVDVTRVVNQLSRASRSTPALWIVTRAAVATEAAQPQINPRSTMLWGFGRTIALEHPELWGGLVDVRDDRDLPALARELVGGSPEDQVALRGDVRFVPRLVRRADDTAKPVVLTPTGVYLVTGGTGALGGHIASWLVARGARRLVLVSRRGSADATAAPMLASLRQAGADVRVITADVGRAEDVDRLLKEVAAIGELRGIVHAAGVDEVVPLAQLGNDGITKVVNGKAAGAALLDARTRDLKLDLFVCFSSMSAVLGSQGRAHYGAANAFLDGLMEERRRRGLAAASINWGPWRGGGMASDSDLAAYERLGNRGLNPSDALAALDRIIASQATNSIVMDIDWPMFSRIYAARRPRPLIEELGRTTPAGPAASTATAGDSAAWVSQLRGVTPDTRGTRLATLVRQEVADTLGFDDVESVPVDANFYHLGMDSLMMADFVSRLRTRTGISCSAIAFDHPQVSSLASELLPRLPLDAAVASDSAAPAIREASLPAAAPAPALDIDGMIAFQAEAFPERRADWVEPRWRWMFLQSAERLDVPARFWVHRDGNRIVGQMGSIAVKLKVGDAVHDTGWLVETMVLEAYRNQAVGSRVMVDAHEDQPFSLSLGQTAEMREIQFRLGWKQVAPLQVAQLLVRPDSVLKGKLPAPAAWAAGLGLRASTALRGWGQAASFRTEVVERFDERHDALWREAARDIGCAVVRDASYLNWKYVDQPGQQFLRVNVLDGSALRGVAIWMLREPDQNYKYRRAFLVDLVAPLREPSTLQQVVKAACDATSALDVDALLCHHVSERLTRALRACGFHLRKPERFLLVDPGPLTGETLDRVLSADEWFVTQGDSDIDRPW